MRKLKSLCIYCLSLPTVLIFYKFFLKVRYSLNCLSFQLSFKCSWFVKIYNCTNLKINFNEVFFLLKTWELFDSKSQITWKPIMNWAFTKQTFLYSNIFIQLYFQLNGFMDRLLFTLFGRVPESFSAMSVC